MCRQERRTKERSDAAAKARQVKTAVCSNQSKYAETREDMKTEERESQRLLQMVLAIALSQVSPETFLC